MPYVSCTKLEAEVAALEAQIDTKQNQLTDSSGGPLAGGTCVLSCTQVEALIADSGNVSAGTNTSVTGTGSLATPYVINVPDSTDSTKGAVELATVAEAQAGTSTTLAVTPAGLKTTVDAAVAAAALKDCSGATIAGGSAVMTCAANGTDGQVLTKQADGSYAWESLPTDVVGLTSVSHDASLTGDGTSGSPLAVVQATDSVAGKVELATTAEATAGTSTTLAVTPAGLQAALDAAALVDCNGASLAGGSAVLACPGVAGTDNQVLTVQADGSYAWETPVTPSSYSLVDCAGAAIASGGSVPSCTEFNTRVPTGGTTGQVLTKQADGSNAWATPAGAATSAFKAGSGAVLSYACVVSQYGGPSTGSFGPSDCINNTNANPVAPITWFLDPTVPNRYVTNSTYAALYAMGSDGVWYSRPISDNAFYMPAGVTPVAFITDPNPV